MKLKYYLRGLGIGILVTALIMGISAGRQKQMSDEEVRARARELGMVESTTLSNLGLQSNKETATGDSIEEKTDETNNETEPTDSKMVETESEDYHTTETEPTDSEVVETEPANGQVAEKEPTDGQVVETEPADDQVVETEPVDDQFVETESTDGQVVETEPVGPSYNETVSDDVKVVTIIISSGESSVTVSNSLEKAGLVESASSYDKYLCSNGYDKKIITGTYHIPMGSTHEDIAKVITGKMTFD